MGSTKHILAGFAAGLIAMSASAASALTIDFNVNRGWTTDTNTYTSNDGSVTVSVNGARINSSGTIRNTSDFFTASWSGSHGGIGVYDCRNTTRSGYCSYDEHTIDGDGPDEFALVDFGGLNVKVTSATFSYWDRHDTFAVGTYDSTSTPTSANTYSEHLGGGNYGSHYTHHFGDHEVTGAVIGFGADSWTDDFKLKSIEFEVISAVPLPAGAVLLLTGLGGIGLMRRRKTKAA